MAIVTNIILVHGAWADGSCWSRLIPLLEAKGFHVTAVQDSLTSLAADAATVRRAMALEEGPLLLVGHSYGGAVITEVGDDAKVAGLVYVAAFAPDAGESAGSLLASVPASPFAAEMRPDATGFLKVTPKGIAEDFAQDLTDVEKQVLTAAQAPTHATCLTTGNTAPAWRKKPSWYIVASEDRTIPPALEETMAKRMNAEITVIPASHVVMISQPEKVAEVIVRAASTANGQAATASA